MWRRVGRGTNEIWDGELETRRRRGRRRLGDGIIIIDVGIDEGGDCQHGEVGLGCGLEQGSWRIVGHD